MPPATDLQLDPATLQFSISMLGFMMAIMSYGLARVALAEQAALQAWGRAMAAAGGAFLLYFLRGHAPWFLTFLVANTLIVGVAVYGLLAHVRLFGVATPRRSITLCAGLAMSGALATYLFDVPRSVAVFTLSTGITGLLLMMAALIVRHTDRRTAPAAWIAAMAVTGAAAALTMRAALSLAGAGVSVEAGAHSAPQIGALVTGAMFIVAASLGFYALVNERQRRLHLEASRRDGLTGLYTRSAYFDLAEPLDALPPPHGYAVVMVDIDHFKAINDQHGHLGGDIVLAHAARLIAGACRICDLAGRYGGEEFCVLLRDADGQAAAQFAQRLIELARAQSVRLQDGRQATYTFSAGSACRSRAGAAAESLTQVMDRADQALYRAKKSGRNQAMTADLLPAELQPVDLQPADLQPADTHGGPARR